MSGPLSRNTQAILLLTAPLIAGKNKSTSKPLTAGEYKRLVRRLIHNQREPADFLGSEATSVIAQCCSDLDAGRIEYLLGRGFQLSQAVDRWQTRALWVMSRADPGYPRRLKTHLGENAPPILYGCGDASMLNSGGLAVVGSRDVSDELVAQSIDTDRQSWCERALAARLKRFGPERPQDIRERARQSRFLVQRGFEQDHIRYALDRSDIS